MNRPSLLLAAGMLAGLLRPADAQWITQSLSLRSGWTAVFLHVDAGHATLDDLVGTSAPVPTPIQEVWRWGPNPATDRFIVSPSEPVQTGTHWTSWRRVDSGASGFTRLSANTAYLIHTTAAYTWNLKGRPVMPAYRWSTAGMNFFGFPTVPVNPPDFEGFLAGVPLLQFAEIFRYTGSSPLGPTYPSKVFTLRGTPVRRGEAYWLRAGDAFNEYYGPFEVRATGSGQVDFGTDLSTFSFRLRNLTGSPLDVSLELEPSEAPPAGQPAIAGTPPILVRGLLNPTNLTHSFALLPVSQPHPWHLAPRGQPGSEAELVLGLDRASITNPPGALLAGVLQVTDSRGHTRVDLGVSASVASSAGLWVGAAAVTHVGQYLQSYLRDAAGQLVIQSNGAYTVTAVVTNLTPVSAGFPLRLIVHNPDTGPATLLQRVYLGLDPSTNPVVANAESALDSARLPDARRLSASHLPWTEANPGWDFSGPLARGAVVSTTVTNTFDRQESNPFLHTYHPDHDNLDARFRNQLPQGSESYTLLREISLSVRPPADDFASRTAAGLTVTGDYLETLRVVGLARAGNTFDTRRFDVRGEFKLSRISELPTLTRIP